MKIPKIVGQGAKFSASSIAAFSLLLSIATSSQAELIATPLPGDTRLVQFPFDEDNTYLVLAKPKAVTHIQFAQDEAIQSVAAGDTAFWELTPTKNRKNLFIKPRYEDIETSMTIITDKRTYQFVLRSTGDQKKWYQRVSWQYPVALVLDQDPVLEKNASVVIPQDRAAGDATPQSNRVQTSAGMPEGLKPGSLRFGYTTEGDAPFRPIQVFDDGKFTYFRMPADMQEMPALFAIIDGQDYALVNYVIQGDYVVAQRLLEAAVFKLGKSEVKVLKTKPTRGFFGFGRNEAS